MDVLGEGCKLWQGRGGEGGSLRSDSSKSAPFDATAPPKPKKQDAGAAPLARDFLERFGRRYTDATYGTDYVFVPKSDAGALHAALAEADAIIDETAYAGAELPGLANVSASLGFSSLAAARGAAKAFKSGSVYRWDGERSPTGGSGWLERAVARPDWVLMDLARAFTPAVRSDALNVTNNAADKGPAGTVRGGRDVGGC